MHSIVTVSPFRCRMWRLHDRFEEEINESGCAAEIASFSAYGQLLPVLGRALKGDPQFDVELIYGARRLFVARHINVGLKVHLHAISDRDAIIAMDIENRQRRDISPYERGRSYLKWLRDGHFSSQDDIARALKVSPSQVSKLLKLARLPAAILGAFASPLDICESWGVDLMEALSDLNKRETILRRARSIAAVSPRPSSANVYQSLLSPSVHGGHVQRRNRDVVVKDQYGNPLFRVSHRNKIIAVLLPIEKISDNMLQDIQSAISEILLHADTQHVHSIKRCKRPDVNPDALEVPAGSIDATEIVPSRGMDALLGEYASRPACGKLDSL